jgi:hypothetical protein
MGYVINPNNAVYESVLVDNHSSIPQKMVVVNSGSINHFPIIILSFSFVLDQKGGALI